MTGPASFGFLDSTPATPPAGAIATIGAGSDTLVLKTSEDAYLGDAQYTVSVDDEQVGGTQTAMSLHGTGASDTLNVLGDWTTGNHTVTVNFLNDAWDGSAATDRNLYVDSATYNGTTVSGATLSLGVTGPASFTFPSHT